MKRGRAKDLPDGWAWRRIGDVVEIETASMKPVSGSLYTYIGLEHLEGETGAFLGVREVDGRKMQSSKYLFDPSHVLYGKLRPYLNKVGLPEFEGICSTDILPLRPRRIVFREYLAFWLRSVRFVDYATKHATGTKMPRLRPPQLRDAPIPLPPRLVQERIVEILQKADEIRRKRQEALDLADAILPSILSDMFGEPGSNPRRYPKVTLGEVAELVTSGYTPRGGARNYIAEGPLLLRSQNVRMLHLDLDDCAHIPETIHEKMARVRVLPGDVLLNITGASIGRVAWAGEDIPPANVNQHVCIVRVKRDVLAPEYLACTLATP